MTGPQQLDHLRAALDEADARAARLAAACPISHWQRRAAGGGWSPSECVQHIAVSAEAMLERINAAVAATSPDGRRSNGPFGAGVLGRLLLWGLEPPYRRLRTRTASAFVPSMQRTPEVDLATLRAAHDAARTSLERARGLALDRLSIVSPFDGRVRYNLYAAYALLPVHARRHLWQAEQSLASHHGPEVPAS